MCPFAPQFVQSGKTVRINMYNGSRRKIQNLYLFAQQKRRSTSGFFSFGIKKGDRPLWTVAFRCFCWVALGAGFNLLEYLGNKLVNAHLNGLVGAIADGDVIGLDLLLAQDEHVGTRSMLRASRIL